MIDQEDSHESFPLIVAQESLASSNSSKMPAIATVQVFDGLLQSLNVGHGVSLAGTFNLKPGITANETEQAITLRLGKESNRKRGSLCGPPFI